MAGRLGEEEEVELRRPSRLQQRLAVRAFRSRMMATTAAGRPASLACKYRAAAALRMTLVNLQRSARRYALLLPCARPRARRQRPDPERGGSVYLVVVIGSDREGLPSQRK